ncbi:hypothetical protein B0H19DRAFT_1249418 [Mycena capillaripes]|nr:hypothetical protein B0H19DRAFT_1249418 [Mycena capillaripes]
MYHLPVASQICAHPKPKLLLTHPDNIEKRLYGLLFPLPIAPSQAETPSRNHLPTLAQVLTYPLILAVGEQRHVQVWNLIFATPYEGGCRMSVYGRRVDRRAGGAGVGGYVVVTAATQFEGPINTMEAADESVRATRTVNVILAPPKPPVHGVGVLVLHPPQSEPVANADCAGMRVIARMAFALIYSPRG